MLPLAKIACSKQHRRNGQVAQLYVALHFNFFCKEANQRRARPPGRARRAAPAAPRLPRPPRTPAIKEKNLFLQRNQTGIDRNEGPGQRNAPQSIS